MRSRMSCRRGSSRGRVARQPSSTTSDPSSEASDFCFDRYLVTRSGRGRGRGQFLTEVRSHQSNSHAARFHFPYTLGNSSFIVSTIGEFCEDTVGSGAVSPGAPLESRMKNQNDSLQNVTAQRKDPGPSAPAGGGPSSKEGQPSESEDPDQFGCRIVEESPPTSHED